MDMPVLPPLSGRLEALDWAKIRSSLHARGYALTPVILTDMECQSIRSLYEHPVHFRSKVIMKRHGFGEGEYQYFSYPLPPMVTELRNALYEKLAPVAQAWAPHIGIDHAIPDQFEDFLPVCNGRGQLRPTPLILKYGPDDYNCLHQDLYGDVVFPIQAAIMLSAKGGDYQGGEFVLTEQRPRMQSRCHALSPALGEMIIFSTRYRPVQGVKRTYRVNMRHGVSPILSGERYTLGIIFHDAQ